MATDRTHSESAPAPKQLQPATAGAEAVGRAAGPRGALQAQLAPLRLTASLISLDDMRLRATTNATVRFLGLPLDEIIGRPVAELLDPLDVPSAMASLEAMRSGAIEFYRAHRRTLGSARPRRGFCSWVRVLEIGGIRYALSRWVDARSPGTRPGVGDVFGRASAIAVADGHGIVQAATRVYPLEATAGPQRVRRLDDVAISHLVGRSVVPTASVGSLLSLDDWRAARIDGVSIAYPVTLRSRGGKSVELEAVATALLPEGWLVGLLDLEPPHGAREAALEGSLWRIAAEIEASGILMRASELPGLALARIQDAAGLSPRQWEILRRLVAGQRVPTIAAELFVTQSTVRNHLSAIFDRFGVHSQSELLARLSATDAPSPRADAVSIA